MEMSLKENTQPREPTGSAEPCRSMGPVIEAPLASVSTAYEQLRLVRPEEYKLMYDSMKRYGQINPAAACPSPKDERRYDLIDGFKRYHACIKLEQKNLTIRLLRGSSHVVKAAMLTLNAGQRTLHAFEEALLVRSLFHEDGLNQRQIAALLGRHKSWACRRMALCERSCEEIVEHIRLGLIGFAVARELWRLPRGNQAGALGCVVKHRLNSRETAQLVDLLLKTPQWEHDKILWLPLDILDRRVSPRPKVCGRGYERFLRDLDAVCLDARRTRSDDFDDSQRQTLSGRIQQTVQRLTELKTVLEVPF